MNIPVFIGLAMARANAIQSGAAPDGPPTDVVLSYYAGTKRRLDWTSGDDLAASRVYYKVGGVYTFIRQEAAGVTSSETGDTTHDVFGVSHYKNGQESAKTDSAEL